jgi:hypothetical protein
VSARDLPLASPVPPASRPWHSHVVALIVAAAIAGLVFAAYRQPDLILDLAAIGLC